MTRWQCAYRASRFALPRRPSKWDAPPPEAVTADEAQALDAAWQAYRDGVDAGVGLDELRAALMGEAGSMSAADDYAALTEALFRLGEALRRAQEYSDATAWQTGHRSPLDRHLELAGAELRRSQEAAARLGAGMVQP